MDDCFIYINSVSLSAFLCWRGRKLHQHGADDLPQTTDGLGQAKLHLQLPPVCGVARRHQRQLRQGAALPGRQRRGDVLRQQPVHQGHLRWMRGKNRPWIRFVQESREGWARTVTSIIQSERVCYCVYFLLGLIFWMSYTRYWEILRHFFMHLEIVFQKKSGEIGPICTCAISNESWIVVSVSSEVLFLQLTHISFASRAV